jgi:hypothetical protein
MADVDVTMPRDTAKADAVATTLADAARLCLEAASSPVIDLKPPNTNVDAA